MEAQNRTLLKGGLPMSSTDFVDQSKASETKLKILAALDHINEIHSAQMNPVDNSDVLNNNAVKETIGNINNDFKMDEYIFSDQIVRNDEPLFVNETNNDDQPLFTEVNAQPEEPLFVNEEYSNEETQSDDLNTMVDNQGEPTLVLSEEEFGKRKKPEQKNKEGRVKSTPDTIKSGRKVAWLAYILFFIPLLFMKNNTFVRHHANEGLELNIMDVIAVALLLVPKFVNSPNEWVELALLISTIIGVILIALSTITKLFLIIFSWAGKEASSPWFGKTKMIR